MNLDRTFCTGLRCKKANICDRWVTPLYKWLKKNENYNSHPISIAEFSDHDGKCRGMYIPVEKEKSENE